MFAIVSDKIQDRMLQRSTTSRRAWIAWYTKYLTCDYYLIHKCKKYVVIF